MKIRKLLWGRMLMAHSWKYIGNVRKIKISLEISPKEHVWLDLAFWNCNLMVTWRVLREGE